VDRVETTAILRNMMMIVMMLMEVELMIIIMTIDENRCFR